MRIKKISGTAVLQGNIVDSLNSNSSLNAPSIRAVNEGLGNIKGKILWTNPNPTNEFASQTITLSSDDYDYLWWIFYNSTEAVKVISAYSIKGLGVNINEIINLNIGVSQSTGFRERQISYINDKQYSITNCLERGGSDSSTPIEKQNRLILAYVIGYKTGLFDNTATQTASEEPFSDESIVSDETISEEPTI